MIQVKVDREALMKFRTHMSEANDIIDRVAEDIAELDGELRAASEQLSKAIIIEDIDANTDEKDAS